MSIHKYIIFFSFLLFACEKNNSILIESSDLTYVSLCSDKQFNNTISVLSFNRLNSTSLNSLSEVIENFNPDVIGLQESYEMGLEIADRLNYCFYGNTENSTAVLSKYPIEGVNDIQSKIILNDSVFVNFFNVHFTAYPYQPYDIRDTLITTEPQAIFQAQQTRGEEVERLQSLINNISNNMPTIITGDFNEPSHLDWITGAENPINFQINGNEFIVDWPISNVMIDMSFIDTYREKYPSPIQNPGYTWTPNNSLDEVHDRIDFIYYRPRYDSGAVWNDFNERFDNHDAFEIALNSVYIIGPDNLSDIVIANYESDHRGVLAIFNIKN